MSPIRTGFIGAGEIARSHAGILKANPDVILGTVYDIKDDISVQFASEHGMQCLSSMEAVIDDSDAIYIASPNKFHAELTCQALGQNKHVFCEKPFALNLTEKHAMPPAKVLPVQGQVQPIALFVPLQQGLAMLGAHFAAGALAFARPAR